MSICSSIFENCRFLLLKQFGMSIFIRGVAGAVRGFA
jgi:hypothetical protein